MKKFVMPYIPLLAICIKSSKKITSTQKFCCVFHPASRGRLATARPLFRRKPILPPALRHGLTHPSSQLSAPAPFLRCKVAHPLPPPWSPWRLLVPYQTARRKCTLRRLKVAALISPPTGVNKAARDASLPKHFLPPAFAPMSVCAFCT